MNSGPNGEGSPGGAQTTPKNDLGDDDGGGIDGYDDDAGAER